MSKILPDFTKHGYQLRTELGQNRLGGRTTYLATNSLGYPVVIKQFQFATSGSSWGEYEAYQQEITMLRCLQHPGIPRYLDAFQTPDGFCMVQQYISGESLASPRNWTPQEIKHIALATLEILTYLQSQHPPIIHRDIKPENILVDEQLKVYLVDFGFARMGGGEIAASSVVKGTMGFMPPEQLFNRQLTTASDLYGLGATLICLLTGTKSGDIGNLIDADYQIHFQHLVPPLKRGWINWLSKITAPKVAERYPNAAAALKALKPIDVERLPKLVISHNSLQFTATKWQEKVSQIVTLSNPIPETLLAGQFSVAPHPSDPPHTPYDHAWISFDRATFEGNEVNCTITVDTSKLLTDTSYTREVWVQSNADAEPEVITVTVQTAPLPEPEKLSYFLLMITIIISAVGGWFLAKNPNILTIPGLIPVLVSIDMTNWQKNEEIKKNIKEIGEKFGIALCGQFSGIVLGMFLLKALDVGFALWGTIGSYILVTITSRSDQVYNSPSKKWIGLAVWCYVWVVITDKFWPITKNNFVFWALTQILFIIIIPLIIDSDIREIKKSIEKTTKSKTIFLLSVILGINLGVLINILGLKKNNLIIFDWGITYIIGFLLVILVLIIYQLLKIKKQKKQKKYYFQDCSDLIVP